MKAFTDAIRLGMLSFGFAMINIFNRQVELILVILDQAIIFCAPVSQYS